MRKPLSILGFLCLCLSLSSQSRTTILFTYETESAKDSIETFGNFYLDGMSRNTVSNPIKDAVNASDKVLMYRKSANADWDAGFMLQINPELIPPSTYNICLDYMSDKAGQCNISMGNLLPESGTLVMPQYQDLGQWQTLCQKIKIHPEGFIAYPSYSPQDRNVYIHPDYGKWGLGEELYYYIDNIRLEYTPTEKEVLFSVNMNDYEKPFDKVYVSGTFNSWSGESHPLSDVDEDGIWETTIITTDEFIEYKYSIDGWNDQEILSEDMLCASSSSDGNGGVYTNRFSNLTSYTVTPTVCYNACHNCIPKHSVTWNLNMNNQEVSEDGVYLAGGLFGHGDYRMTDPDNDGIYSITVNLREGISTNYTFINGLCPLGWWCKEDISGQACADENHYNDRFLNPLYGNREMNMCFGFCSSQGLCEEEQLYNVTFNLEDKSAIESVSYFLAGGSINSWNAYSSPLEKMGKQDLYSITVQLPPGVHEYKYVRDKTWETLNQEQGCTMTDATGLYTNRYVEVIDRDIYLPAVEFGQCEGFSSTTNFLSIDEELDNITVYPTVSKGMVTINLEAYHFHEDIILTGYNSVGQQLDVQILRGGQEHEYDISAFNAGIHYLHFETRYGSSTKRVLKQ